MRRGGKTILLERGTFLNGGGQTLSAHYTDF